MSCTIKANQEKIAYFFKKTKTNPTTNLSCTVSEFIHFFVWCSHELIRNCWYLVPLVRRGKCSCFLSKWIPSFGLKKMKHANFLMSYLLLCFLIRVEFQSGPEHLAPRLWTEYSWSLRHWYLLVGCHVEKVAEAAWADSVPRTGPSPFLWDAGGDRGRWQWAEVTGWCGCRRLASRGFPWCVPPAPFLRETPLCCSFLPSSHFQFHECCGPLSQGLWPLEFTDSHPRAGAN